MKIILSESDSFDRTRNKYAKLVVQRTKEFAKELADEINRLEEQP